MRVKRYVADSIQEAIARVKNDLGRNAIILHTKPFKEGGFLGMFARRRFEVIAAVDENLPETQSAKKNEEKKEMPGSSVAQSSHTSVKHNPGNPSIQEHPQAHDQGTYQHSPSTQTVVTPAHAANVQQDKSVPSVPGQQAVMAQTSPPQQVLYSPAQVAQHGIQSVQAQNTVHPVVSRTLAGNTASQPATISQPKSTRQVQPAPAPRGSAPSAATVSAVAPGGGSHAELQTLRNEIAEMKELIRQVTAKSDNSGTSAEKASSGLTLGFDWLQQYLTQLGMEGEIIDYLLLQIPDYLAGGTNVPEEDLIDCCHQVLASRLMFAEPIQSKKTSEQQIMALIGPTGVGKTTTIAKLAANYHLFQRKKVGLITIDTYRIAAVEHLKTYGEIINLPVEVVYSPSDLNQSFNNLRDCELILIDTAGRSPHNQAMMDELKKFLSHSKIGLILLVISATTQYQDMLNIAENFSKIAYTHMVFTKIDETKSLGPVVSLAWKNRRPISYLTTGQNVPDDIEVANADKLLSQLFRRYSLDE